MYCKKCGKKISKDNKFCNFCGEKIIKNNKIENKNIENNWKDYSDLTNSDIDLTKKAKLLAPLIADVGLDVDKFLLDIFTKDKKSSKKNTKTIDEKKGTLRLQFICLFMSISDRIAFGSLGDEKRSLFIDNLILSVAKHLFNKSLEEVDDSNIASKISSFIDSWNVFQGNYGNCKSMIADKDESPKDTLFWEFSKNITALIDKNDLAAMMEIMFLIIRVVGILQIANLLEEK